MTSDVKSLYKRLVLALTKRAPEPLTAITSLVQENAQVLQSQDAQGYTPLHHALYRVFDSKLPSDVIQYLVRQCPESVEMVTNRQETPLHLACAKKAPLETILLLLELHPKAAEMTDGSKKTPLHCACEIKSYEVVVGGLLAAFPKAAKMKDTYGCTPLHYACRKHYDPSVYWTLVYEVRLLDHCVELVKILIESFPQAAQMQDDNGNSPLHDACSWYSGSAWVVYHVALACPIACLLYNNAEQLPFDSSREQVEFTNCLAPTTVDAACGLIDATFHPFSGVPQAVVSHVQKSLSAEILATINANGMIQKETIDLPTVKGLLKHEAVQTMLKEEQSSSLIQGFIQMNEAGRKDAVKDGAYRVLGISFCAIVSDNVACLFAHLRENPSLCMHRVTLVPT